MGYGLGGAGASPLSGQGGKRPVAVVGDGGFWHNGLVSSVGHQVFNKTDGVMLIVDNGYAAATGGQDILSSAANVETRSTQHPIEKAVRGVGVESSPVRTVRLRRGSDGSSCATDHPLLPQDRGRRPPMQTC